MFKAGITYQLFCQMPTAKHFVPFRQTTYNKTKVQPLKPCYSDNVILNIFLFQNLTLEEFSRYRVSMFRSMFVAGNAKY